VSVFRIPNGLEEHGRMPRDLFRRSRQTAQKQLLAGHQIEAKISPLILWNI